MKNRRRKKAVSVLTQYKTQKTKTYKKGCVRKLRFFLTKTTRKSTSLFVVEYFLYYFYYLFNSWIIFLTKNSPVSVVVVEVQFSPTNFTHIHTYAHKYLQRKLNILMNTCSPSFLIMNFVVFVAVLRTLEKLWMVVQSKTKREKINGTQIIDCSPQRIFGGLTQPYRHTRIHVYVCIHTQFFTCFQLQLFQKSEEEEEK